MEDRMLECQKDILSLANSLDFDVGYIYESQRTLDEIKERCSTLLHDLRPYSFLEWVNSNSDKFMLEIDVVGPDIKQLLENLTINRYEYTTSELVLGTCQKELVALESRIGDRTILITSTTENYIDIFDQELFVAGMDNYAQNKTNDYYMIIVKILSRMSNIDDGDCYLKLLE